MKMSGIIYRLKRLVERMFQLSRNGTYSQQVNHQDDRLWVEDDEFLNECIRKTKEIWQEYEKTKKLPEEDGESKAGLKFISECDKAVNRMDEGLKIPYQLFSQGYSYKEIAGMLQTNVGAVKSRIKKAQKEVKNILSDEK